MIEINLRPDVRKRAGRRRLALSLPKFGGGGGGARPRDAWRTAAGAAVLLALAGAAWLFLGTYGVAEELEVRIEAAVRDSIRYEDVIRRSGVLQARRDSIAERVAIIQQIDGSRYVWPHILDEVARALPDFTWLMRLVQVTGGDPVIFRLDGRSGTYFGVTTLMENLEASPFLAGVELISSEQISIPLGGGANQFVYEFTLEVGTREPPPELVERVPLFGPTVLPPGTEGD